MKYLLMLIVCFGFLTGCEKATEENTKVTELEKQVEELKQQLIQSTDPATISKLQKELLVKLVENIKVKREQIGNLYTQIEKTKDEVSCKTLKTQIKKENKELDALVLEFDAMAIAGGAGFSSRELGTCSVTGYKCPTISKGGEVIEVCYDLEKDNTNTSSSVE